MDISKAKWKSRERVNCKNCVSLICAIFRREVFLTTADLGFFTIGKIAFTILHIPVFIVVIEIGLLPGFII